MPAMKIHRTSLLEGAAGADNCAVIVDVFRAFTCASVLLHYEVAELRLEHDASQCLRLKENEGYLAVGEIDGVTVAGFDLGNSPAGIAAAGPEFFRGRKVALRTSAGVQGVFAARKRCDQVWAGSFTTARTLAKAISRDNPAQMHIVAMGWNGKDRMPEDEHCALYIHSLLDPAVNYDHTQALREILGHESARKFLRADKEHFPPADVTWCLQRDLYDFAMKIDTSAGYLTLVKANV